MAFRQRPSRGACDDDPEAGPGPSTARFYSRSDTIPHVSDPYNSTSTSPDDDSRTLYSDEELIVTADTYPTPNDDYQVPEPIEEELASHVAMFLPSGSSRDSDPQTAQGVRWCNEILSVGLYKPHSHPEGEVQSAEMATTPPTRRRAISLDAFDGSAANPQWPGNVPAVRVHQPPFPPPIRMPTPPGVPSFGTPEAIAASAQFIRDPFPPNNQRVRSLNTAAIRRLFGIQSPIQPLPTPSPSPPATTTAATTIQSVRGIGRAPDGTRVLGGFGYRQSGHGTDLAQELDDHTFHVNNIPLAAPSITPAEDNPAESRRTRVGTAAETSSFKSTLSLPKRYARLFRPSIAEMFASTSPDPGSSPTRSSPRSSSRSPARSPSRDFTADSALDSIAMVAPPRNPARIRDQRRQYPGQDGLSNSFQRHTVVNQIIQEEEPDTEPEPVPQPNAAYIRGRIVEVINQGTGQGTGQGTNQGTPLEPITSQDSYVTAPSQSSPVRNGSPQRRESNHDDITEQPERRVWTPVSNFVRRGAAVLKQRIP
ncbi:unnamed protein product [Penicillium manginii]